MQWTLFKRLYRLPSFAQAVLSKTESLRRAWKYQQQPVDPKHVQPPTGD